jgi:hypothetical protein
VPLWCLLFGPHLTTHQSNIGVGLGAYLNSCHGLSIVQWGTNQNVVFEIAARKLSRLPTLKAFLELKNWYFSTIFLPKNYLLS